MQSALCELFGSYRLQIWPYRLGVRTPGSHPGNPGSIPGRVTTKNAHPKGWAFFVVFVFAEVEPAGFDNKERDRKATS